MKILIIPQHYYPKQFQINKIAPEALACGTPVITYRTGGSPEAIDEKTGIVVEQGNVQAMADAILSLREHPLSSEDCRKRAEMLFDKDKCFEKYIELYDSLLHK